MIRKWMSLFLAVIMAFAMPMSAFADVQHTLAVKPGELLQSEEAIADLLEVLKLRLTLGEESGALTVLLDDSNVVTLGLTADATGLYAGSNLFGADILYITWDDIFALIGDVLIESMAEAGAEEEVLQQLRAGFEEAKKEIIAAAGGMMSAPQTEATASLEESLKAAEELFPDDPAMVAFIMKLYEDMVIETGSFADEARDTADQKHRLTMDEENLLALCETAYMKNAITKALAAEMPEASEAELSIITAGR